jgi:hypothetical protein
MMMSKMMLMRMEVMMAVTVVTCLWRSEERQEAEWNKNRGECTDKP